MESNQGNSVQQLVAKLANAKGYDLNITFITRKIDHPKGTKDSDGNVIQVVEYQHPDATDKTVWLKQSEVHSLVISNGAFDALQLDEDIIPVVLSESGTKVRSTHKLTWVKVDVIDTPVMDLTERIKGLVTLTELSIKALKVEEQIMNMSKNASLTFNPADIIKVQNILLPKLDLAFNTLVNKASNVKKNRKSREPKPVRFVSI